MVDMSPTLSGTSSGEDPLPLAVSEMTLPRQRRRRAGAEGPRVSTQARWELVAWTRRDSRKQVFMFNWASATSC